MIMKKIIHTIGFVEDNNDEILKTIMSDKNSLEEATERHRLC